MFAIASAVSEPALSDTFIDGVCDVSRYFDEVDGGLPRFLGGSIGEYAAVWRALRRKDVATRWKMAAIAASLGRVAGQRTDRQAQLTPIQEFAREQGIEPGTLSRFARTYHAFNRPDDPEINRLVADPFFGWKHFVIAACSAEYPAAALEEARAQRWTANELGRQIRIGKHSPRVRDSALTPRVEWHDLSDAEQRELKRIREEMDALPYVSKTFNPSIRGRGGDMVVVGGCGGAAVFYDILGGSPNTGTIYNYSRKEVLKRLHQFSTGEHARSVVSDLAVDVAKRRLTGDRSLRPAELPPSAGDVPEPLVVNVAPINGMDDAQRTEFLRLLERYADVDELLQVLRDGLVNDDTREQRDRSMSITEIAEHVQ